MSAKTIERKGSELEFMTWPEAESLFKKNPVVVIPIGAQAKEHGPHLPLNNDWMMARYLTDRILEKYPVVALPIVPYGYFPAFTEYPGSTSISAQTFRDTIVGICESLAGQGIKKFYGLNTGISTLKPLLEAQEILRKKGLKFEFTDFSKAIGPVESSLASQKRGTHADEIETSMMLFMTPQIVHMERAVRDDNDEIDSKNPGPLTRNREARLGVFSPSGSWGDPTLATREKGEKVTKALIENISDSISHLIEDSP